MVWNCGLLLVFCLGFWIVFHVLDLLFCVLRGLFGWCRAVFYGFDVCGVILLVSEFTVCSLVLFLVCCLSVGLV